MRLQSLLFLALTVCAVACNGALSPFKTVPTNSQNQPPQYPGLPPVDGNTPMVFGTGAHPLARLTRPEFIRTIETLSDGKASIPENSLPADSTDLSGFLVDAPISQGSLAALMDALTPVAPTIRSVWASKVACTSQDEACAKKFITEFGRSAFRRPLTDAEVKDKLDSYTKLKSLLPATHDEALNGVVKAFCLSPYFLYHSERATDAVSATDKGWVQLDPFEMASRLSYTLWRTMPDEQLLQKASAGLLLDDVSVREEATRMMQNEKFKATLNEFVNRWAGIADIATTQKDSTRFPQFSKALAADFASETSTFVEAVLGKENGSFKELLTADYTFANQRLSGFYANGTSTPATGTAGAFEKISLNAADRAGLFTQPAFLAAHALPAGNSPPRRGKFVAERVLCATVPPPDASLMIVIPEEKPNETTREAFTSLTKGTQCAGCHAILNPIGFSFEKYDALGAIQTTERGKPIDSSVKFLGQQFAAAPELLRTTAQSPEVAACIGTQWFRFVMQRHEENEEKDTVTMAGAGFSADEMRVKGLVQYLVSTNSFRFRNRFIGE